jgi:hypothetical protein
MFALTESIFLAFAMIATPGNLTTPFVFLGAVFAEPTEVTNAFHTRNIVTISWVISLVRKLGNTFTIGSTVALASDDTTGETIPSRETLTGEFFPVFRENAMATFITVTWRAFDEG